MPDHLEDWLTDTGADVIRKRIGDPSSLSPSECLVYEIWLLDTEARNGGLSQYFCNRGLAHWNDCVALAQIAGLEPFAPFARAVDVLIAGHEDPYAAIIDSPGGDSLWYDHQAAVVEELHGRWQGPR